MSSEACTPPPYVLDLAGVVWAMEIPSKAVLEAFENERGIQLDPPDLKRMALAGLGGGDVSVVEEGKSGEGKKSNGKPTAEENAAKPVPVALQINGCYTAGASVTLTLPPDGASSAHALTKLGVEEGTSATREVAVRALCESASARTNKDKIKSLETQLKMAFSKIEELEVGMRNRGL